MADNEKDIPIKEQEDGSALVALEIPPDPLADEEEQPKEPAKAEEEGDHEQDDEDHEDDDGQDDEETEDGAIVIFFDSRWSPPCSWFAEMVQSNSNIAQACLSFADPNMLSVGEVEWDGSILTETYRDGTDLTADDYFILGVEQCEKCSAFLFLCDGALEGIYDAV